MSLRDTRLFVAVYEERSFTAAAARENATQSGVSQRIRLVEDYSGVLTQQVRAGELAFAVVPALPAAVGLKTRLFLRTPELLVSGNRGALKHLAPVRLAALGPLKIVVPGAANTRRRHIET